MKNKSPSTIVAVLVSLILAWAAAACSTLPGASIGSDYLPGGVRFYSAGSALNKEYMSKHVKRVQYEYSLYASQRKWKDSSAGPVPSSVNMLQTYYPLHVRWELKDGRQFIAENIDVRGLMREYFKTHDIQMQWQREGREQGVGDSDPSLVYEVQEDEVIVKWFITINQTPFKERILPTGAATRWKFTTEQYVVGTVKGNPTSGIDFEQQWEFNLKKK